MNFIELYFDDVKPEPFTPNNMRCFPEARRCRHCGVEGDRNTLRYEKGLHGEAWYDCRDTAACGERLREGQPINPNEDCPF